jgi:hypothetical protein
MQATYLPVAQTARLVRAALAKAFPGTRFSVTSQSYSGGCSVRVRWTDGPLRAEVEPIASMFQGKRFDGSIDLAWSASLWLMPDGTATVASDPGSAGSGGYHGPVREWMPHPDAKLICTGAYVFCDRATSPELNRRVAAWIERRGGWEAIWRAQDERQAIYMVACRSRIVAGALVVAKERVGA